MKILRASILVLLLHKKDYTPLLDFIISYIYSVSVAFESDRRKVTMFYLLNKVF